jgi:hypothetical protein
MFPHNVEIEFILMLEEKASWAKPKGIFRETSKGGEGGSTYVEIVFPIS